MITDFSTIGSLQAMALQITRRTTAQIKPDTQIHNSHISKINGSQVLRHTGDYFISKRLRIK